MTEGNKIFISDKEKEELFKKLLLRETNNDKREFNYLLSADYLEQICMGNTEQCDKAYGSIKRKLKNEYLKWKEVNK